MIECLQLRQATGPQDRFENSFCWVEGGSDGVLSITLGKEEDVRKSN